MDSKFFKNVNKFIKEMIDIVNGQNFNEIFPGYNFKEILPELPMNEDGHPNIDYEKFYININNLHYIDFMNVKKSFYNVFNKNKYLDLINVFHILNNLDISSDANKKFLFLIKEFGTDDETLFVDPEDIDDNTSISNDDFGYYYNYGNFDFLDSQSSSWDYDSPSSGWNYDSPSSGWNYDTPSSSWNYDSWNYDTPSSSWNYDSWNYDTPSSSWNYDSWNYDTPSSSWNYDSPSSSWNNDSPSSSWDDDILSSSSFSFIDFIRSFFINQSDSDNEEVNSMNAKGFNTTVEELSFIDDGPQPIFIDIFNSKDFEELFQNYDFDKIENNDFSYNGTENDFKTKNATLIVEINK